MSKKHHICVLGGTGFVGRHVVAKLVEQKHQIRVLSRHRERHRDLLVMPTVEVNTANIHDPDELKKQLQGCDTVINLVGILHQSQKKGRSFQAAHVELARNVINACKANNITRLLHMSALKADAGRGSSRYLRSKGEAENLVHTNKDLQTTSFRPSVIFGAEDDFLNRFANLMKLYPKYAPFPLACASAKFAPVYVEDVASAIVKALDDKATFGGHYDLCGPKVYTLKQLMEYTGDLIGAKPKIVSLGNGLSKLQAIIFSMLPGKIFTLDNYLSMQQDNICVDSFPPEFGFKPASLESIAPSYLADQQIRARYSQYRKHANREI